MLSLCGGLGLCSLLLLGIIILYYCLSQKKESFYEFKGCKGDQRCEKARRRKNKKNRKGKSRGEEKWQHRMENSKR